MSHPATKVLPERGDAGHPHVCTRGHRRQHAGSSANGCSLPTADSHTGSLGSVSPADCAVCAGRGDLLMRPLHSHECPGCEGEWSHEGRCGDGLVAWCPWDFASPSHGAPPGTRMGRHLHYCPDCRIEWLHLEGCAAPLRVSMPSCPGCGNASRGRFVLAAIGGLALGIVLVSLKLLPINPADWLMTARRELTAVTPSLHSANHGVSPPSAAGTEDSRSGAPENGPALPLKSPTDSSRVESPAPPTPAPLSRRTVVPSPADAIENRRRGQQPGPELASNAVRIFDPSVVPPRVPLPPPRPILTLPERVAIAPSAGNLPNAEPKRQGLPGSSLVPAPPPSGTPTSAVDEPSQGRWQDPSSGARDAPVPIPRGPTSGASPRSGPTRSPLPSSSTVAPVPSQAASPLRVESPASPEVSAPVLLLPVVPNARSLPNTDAGPAPLLPAVPNTKALPNTDAGPAPLLPAVPNAMALPNREPLADGSR
jgi:hypothetical protein